MLIGAVHVYASSFLDYFIAFSRFALSVGIAFTYAKYMRFGQLETTNTTALQAQVYQPGTDPKLNTGISFQLNMTHHNKR